MVTTLHDADFNAWTQEQAARLRQAAHGRINDDLDWENLAEEIEGMGGSERGEIENRLIVLLNHLAKLAWSPDTPPRRVWRVTVSEQRRRLALRTRKSPSLRGYPAEVLGECWDIARPRAEVDLDVREGSLPAICPWDLTTQVLDDDWLPAAPTDNA